MDWRYRGWLAFALIAVPVLIWFAWTRGQRTAASTANAWTFRVSGNSMAPTLFGEFELATCDRCQLDARIDSGQSPERSDSRCAHCGGQLRPISSIDSVADVVEITPISVDRLRPGDLVAVRWEQQLRIKRVAACPGNRVDLDGLSLVVDGTRVEDLIVANEGVASLPWFLVDDDRRRSESRWSAEDEGWGRAVDRAWRWNGGEPSRWLVYHHRSIHDQNQPSCVWDDYQVNVRLQRRLHAVDRFALSGEVDCESTQLEVAFWSRRGSSLATMQISGNQAFAVTSCDSNESKRLPVSPERPVAIRVQGGAASVSKLAVRRLIEFRVRPRDTRHFYPQELGDREFFLLGDNVPVSVDSRDVGPLQARQIVGLVKKLRGR